MDHFSGLFSLDCDWLLLSLSFFPLSLSSRQWLGWLVVLASSHSSLLQHPPWNFVESRNHKESWAICAYFHNLPARKKEKGKSKKGAAHTPTKSTIHTTRDPGQNTHHFRERNGLKWRRTSR
jgi:hypothetical protein